ncbi:phosphatase PAP2 family protein [Kitasatospora sp. GP82]|uniref:phosphatase PAP2 family protein n=1 Tax=Kitasatospora sp. GP82 TaxID=3035089 RepID=UPI002473353A|nr:phosphatase PAP2 family protein [Kitasatospora sp. GP82]MDH6124193.1 membrane-associated phospholipid phosphatase [Kitasatospora sp. GP82]
MPDLSGAVANADRRISLAVRGRFKDQRSVQASRALSFCGEHAAGWLAIGLAGAVVDTERRGQWLRATAAVAGAHAASMVVKRVVRRPRPHGPGLEPLVQTAGKHSFPSSHAASSAAAAVAFAPLMPASALAPAAAAAMCFSRIVVGVHYPSDIVGGAAMGAGLARLGRKWIAAGGRDR